MHSPSFAIHIVTAIALGNLAACGATPQQDKVSAKPAEHHSDQTVEVFESGFSIDGGAKVTDSANVELDISPPPGATSFLVSEDYNFRGSAVQDLAATFTFTLGGFGQRKVYLMFLDADGDPIESHERTITVEPFPLGSLRASFAEGATSPSKSVTLELFYPDSAAMIRFSQRNVLESVKWQPIAPQFPIILTAIGQQTLYVQFQNREGIPSSIYQAIVEVVPFADGQGSITINNDATTSEGVDLTLAIAPPTGATEMLIYAGQNRFGRAFQPISTQETFVATTGGLTTISVIFRDAEGNETFPVSDNIFVELFPDSQVSMSLSASPSGNSLEISVTDLEAPTFAQDMQFSLRESFSGSIFEAFSSTKLLSVPYCAATMDVYLRLRDANGYTGKPIVRTLTDINCDTVPAAPCDLLAEEAYIVNLSAATEGSCQGCHAGNANRIRFIIGNPTANRDALLNYTGTSAMRLIQKMNGEAAHGGGIQSILTATKIQDWFDQEAQCN